MKQQLYEDIKRQVLTLELRPGEALDETVLGTTYQLSRTPVREILRQLAGEGYLQLTNNRGATVALMDHLTLRHFFMTAPMVYAAIGQLAAEASAEAARDTYCEPLHTAQTAFRQAVAAENPEQMVYWNDQFHRQMGTLAGNPYLIPSYERLLIDHARISQTFYRPQHEQDRAALQQACDDHDAMIVAIENGDSAAIVAQIHQHWTLSQAHMQRYVVAPEPLPFHAAAFE